MPAEEARPPARQVDPGPQVAAGPKVAPGGQVARPGTVLMVSGQAERYGADRSLRVLTEGLVQRGWQVTVSLPGDGPLAADLATSGVRSAIIDPGVLRRVNDLRDWAGLLALGLPAAIRHVRSEARRHDIVHINSVVIAGGLLGAALSGKPTVCHLRESFAGHRRQFRAYAQVLRRLPVTYVAVSKAIAAEAAEAGLGARTVVVHNSIDLAPIPCFDAARDRAEAVLSVGRINDWKGHDILVEAIALLRDRGLIVPLRIAGDVYPGGERYRLALEARVARLGLDTQVELLGFVDDVASLLASHAIFALPSVRPEPFGLALVEAMAHGMACVATAAGGPAEIVDDGRTGLLVPPGDALALAGAIQRLWRDRDLRTRLGRAAATEVRSRFGSDHEVDRIEALYQSLLARSA